MSSSCTSCRQYNYGGQVYDSSRRCSHSGSGCPPCTGTPYPPPCPPPPCPPSSGKALYDLPLQICNTLGTTANSGRIQYTLQPVSLSGTRNYANVSIRYNWTGSFTAVAPAATTFYQELYGTSPGAGFSFSQIIPDPSYLVPFIPPTTGTSIYLPTTCTAATGSYIPYAVLSGSTVGINFTAQSGTTPFPFATASATGSSILLLMVAGSTTTTPTYRMIVITTIVAPSVAVTSDTYSFETVLNGQYLVLGPC